MVRFDDVWASADEADGWLTEAQGRALFDAAAACRPDGRIVEIGSFRGRSTIVLADAAAAGVEVLAIDPFAGSDRGPQEIEGYSDHAIADLAVFESNLTRAGVRDRVTHLRSLSSDALGVVDGTVDVLFIDGAHRYRPARADIRDWGGRVADGGMMLIHDSFSSVGVTLATLRELLLSRRFRFERRVGSLAIYRADADGGRDWHSAVHISRQLPWFAKNLALKVLITARLLKGRDWPY